MIGFFFGFVFGTIFTGTVSIGIYLIKYERAHSLEYLD